MISSVCQRFTGVHQLFYCRKNVYIDFLDNLVLMISFIDNRLSIDLIMLRNTAIQKYFSYLCQKS